MGTSEPRLFEACLVCPDFEVCMDMASLVAAIPIQQAAAEGRGVEAVAEQIDELVDGGYYERAGQGFKDNMVCDHPVSTIGETLLVLTRKIAANTPDEIG